MEQYHNQKATFTNDVARIGQLHISHDIDAAMACYHLIQEMAAAKQIPSKKATAVLS